MLLSIFPWLSLCLLLPFTLMLSPKCASVRISSQSAMVNDVPPPPPDEMSRGSREVTAAGGPLV